MLQPQDMVYICSMMDFEKTKIIKGKDIATMSKVAKFFPTNLENITYDGSKVSFMVRVFLISKLSVFSYGDRMYAADDRIISKDGKGFVTEKLISQIPR